MILLISYYITETPNLITLSINQIFWYLIQIGIVLFPNSALKNFINKLDTMLYARVSPVSIPFEMQWRVPFLFI